MPKYRLLTPGPVAVPERVLLAMARTLLHHRAPAFIPVFKEVRANLKKVFQTEQDVLILASTGTGAMEAAVINTLSPGDKAVVVRGGKFGERWTEICQANGIACANAARRKRRRCSCRPPRPPPRCITRSASSPK